MSKITTVLLSFILGVISMGIYIAFCMYEMPDTWIDLCRSIKKHYS